MEKYPMSDAQIREYFQSLRKTPKGFSEKEDIKEPDTVYSINRLKVDYSRAYLEFLKKSCPQTRMYDSVRSIGDNYKISEFLVKEKDIIIANWSDEKVSYFQKIIWGLRNNFFKTTPHVLFSIAERYQNLASRLKSESVYLIETTGFKDKHILYALCVEIGEAERIATTDQQCNFNAINDWFVFMK